LIIIKPTKIKTGFYLLIPRAIVEYLGIKDNTKFRMEISYSGKKIIRYVEKQKVKCRIKRKSKRRR